MERIIVYADGAVRGNQFDKNVGAWGAILNYKNSEKKFGGIVCNTTNNICELSAVIDGLNKIKDKMIPVTVISDSQYVVSGINEWSKNWIANGWKNANNKPIENQGLWRWLLDVVNRFEDIKFEKCKGHSDNDGNTRVDLYCNEIIDKYISERSKK